MGLFSHKKSKSKVVTPEASAYHYEAQYPFGNESKRRAPLGVAATLPVKVLDTIFAWVCPHTQDLSYTSCEESLFDNGCSLCDMKALAQCALVCRRWSIVAENRLYRSIRIDPVHFCALEIDLALKRRRKSFFERNGEPKDATQERLKLLARTVRGRDSLAHLVQTLKMPYMARESCKADLARTVSVLPHLQYVDLPDGVFRDDPSTLTLRQELQHRCGDLRKMRYLRGAEESFRMAAQARPWANLEALELSGLQHVEPDALLHVLDAFPGLHTLAIDGLEGFEDAVLAPSDALPPFPPVATLTLQNLPRLTAAGLTAHLSRPESRASLTSLRLSQTGVLAQTLHVVLGAAPALQKFAFGASNTSKSFPIAPVPPLASRSLRTLHYEILPSSPSLAQNAETYYAYLATSLLSGALPSLTALYAYSTSLPDLLLAPPSLPFAPPGRGGGGGPRAGSFSHSPSPSRFSTYSTTSSTSSGSRRPSAPTYSHSHPKSSQSQSHPPIPLPGLSSPLNLFTRSSLAPELEWNYTRVDPPSASNGRRGSMSATRPLSLVLNEGGLAGLGNGMVGLALGSPTKVPGARETLVGNGFGGFLAVPCEEERPGSRGGTGVGRGAKGGSGGGKGGSGGGKGPYGWMG